MLLAESEPSRIRWRLADFYDAALDAAMPETTRLANTIQTWWPAILVALTEQRHQRPHRGLQPDHQTDQAGRLRLPEHGQLPAPYPQPHRGHPTAEISSMNGLAPLKIEEEPRNREPGQSAVVQSRFSARLVALAGDAPARDGGASGPIARRMSGASRCRATAWRGCGFSIRNGQFAGQRSVQVFDFAHSG